MTTCVVFVLEGDIGLPASNPAFPMPRTSYNCSSSYQVNVGNLPWERRFVVSCFSVLYGGVFQRARRLLGFDQSRARLPSDNLGLGGDTLGRS